MNISNFKAVNKGALKATFSVTLPKWANFTIHNMTYWESNGRSWVNFPGSSYEKEGKKKFFQYCKFEDSKHQEAFQQALMKMLEEELKKQAHGKQTSVVTEDDLPF